MLNADKGAASGLDGSKLHIGIVQARFNEGITNALAKACREELQALGVPDDHIQHVLVPGALEVPVALQAMAESDNFDALIALGCIIRGETYHFELVANESGAGHPLELVGFAVHAAAQRAHRAENFAFGHVPQRHGHRPGPPHQLTLDAVGWRA